MTYLTDTMLYEKYAKSCALSGCVNTFYYKPLQNWLSMDSSRGLSNTVCHQQLSLRKHERNLSMLVYAIFALVDRKHYLPILQSLCET